MIRNHRLLTLATCTDEQSLSERARIGGQALFLADPNDICSACPLALASQVELFRRGQLLWPTADRGLQPYRPLDISQTLANVVV
jgi:hypothetical protein